MKKKLCAGLLILLSTLMLSSCLLFGVFYNTLTICNDSDESVYIDRIYSDDGERITVNYDYLPPGDSVEVSYLLNGSYRIYYNVNDEERFKKLNIYCNRTFHITNNGRDYTD